MTPALTGIIGFGVLMIPMFQQMPVGFVMAIVGYLKFGYVVSLRDASNLTIRDFFHIDF